MTQIKKGNKVSWKWGKNTADGKVVDTSTEKKQVSSKGSKITRNGSKDNPAVTIKQDNGTKVLKRKSELK